MNTSQDLIRPPFFNSLDSHFIAIEKWFQKAFEAVEPPFYGSVDLRHAGFKLAPIDMNFYPAGFNNFSQRAVHCASRAARKVVSQWYPECQRILIIPENHTRNPHYFMNLYNLKTILENAGYEVCVGSMRENLTQREEVALENGKSLDIFPLLRKGDLLQVEGFVPELVVLNNDLSSGMPDFLEGVRQPIRPSPYVGWFQRQKTGHFRFYKEVCEAFGQHFQIDPWFFDAEFRHCGQIDFMARAGEASLLRNAEALFEAIQAKYQQYGITQNPFIVVKANAGTYGMAVMTVRNLDELQQLNRKQRTRMSASKGGQAVQEVILQEGVPTIVKRGEKHIAEPVVYCIGNYVTGGFYRMHENRLADESLNAPGMVFEPFEFSCCFAPEDQLVQGADAELYLYSIAARLSMLAAGKEKQEILK